MTKHSFSVLIFMLAIVFHATAQHTNVLISTLNSPEEPSICVNPHNLYEVVAGANLNNYFYSSDGGSTWEVKQLTSPYGVWGDPCIVCDTNGDFYFFHLANPPAGNWIDRIVCQKSTDAGQTWSDGTYTGLNGNKVQDKEWAIVERSTNTIYVTWTQFDAYGSSDPDHFSNIMFSKSTDGGQTWTPAQRINQVSGDCIDNDNTVEGAVPAIGPEGQVYVSWAGPLGLVFDKSTDGGETWLEDDIVIGEFPGGWTYDIPGIYRANGLPVTLCDTSQSAYRGTIYVNWSDQRNGANDTDVWLSKSTDGGETWSNPLRINNDGADKQQFFTWMTIDQTNGHLYCVFYDRRHYNDQRTDVYMAVSTDGGESFVNFKINDTPFLPNESVFFGDYTNISAHNGVVRPIWTALDGSYLSIWTALIDVNALPSSVESVENQNISLEQNHPNPFADETYFSFKLHRPSVVELKVVDVQGREIAVLRDNEYLETGKYIETFRPGDYNLQPGVYYFSLITEEQTITRKMVVTQ